MNFAIYTKIKKIKVFNSIIERIESRMEILYPDNREKVIKNTVIELYKMLICSFMVFIAFIVYGKISI